MVDSTIVAPRAFVWGANSHGQLCINHLRDCHSPTPCHLLGFPVGAAVCAIACGGGHTALLDAHGGVWLCGSYDDLPAGALPPSFVRAWPVPSHPSAAEVTMVACGFDFSVLVLADGRCFAWGHNNLGQLASSASELSYSECLREVAGLPAARIVSCGLDTCVALCSTPHDPSAAACVYEWGGKCGHVPRRVSFPESAAPAAVAAGARHRACSSLDGRLFLWGSGLAVRGLPTLPQFVDGARVRCCPHSLVCTWRGTAFVAPDGGVNVIGPNDFMQHGCAASALSRAVVSFADGDKCIKLFAGSEHLAAVLARADGSLRIATWGWGEHGQLGTGSTVDGGPCSVAEFSAGQRLHVASGAAFVVAVVIPADE